MIGVNKCPSRVRDLTGMRFGNLEVIGFHEYHQSSSNRFAKFVCRCDCGQVASVIGAAMISGNTKSCGCKQVRKKSSEVCSFEGCEKPIKAHGFCKYHYGRLRETGSPNPPHPRVVREKKVAKKRIAKSPFCSIDGCTTKRADGDFCFAHARRMREFGDANGGPPIIKAGQCLEYLLSTLSIDTDECILWPFSKNRKGYGHLQYNGKKHMAHRVVLYETVGEPNDAAFEASHLCNNGHQGCINHKHLIWESSEDNAARKTYAHTKKITINGADVALAEVCGGSATQRYAVAYGRIRKGWCFECAVSIKPFGGKCSHIQTLKTEDDLLSDQSNSET